MNAENSIIYVLLNNQDAILKTDLEASMFSNTTLGEAFYIMRELTATGNEVDAVSILSRMKAPDSRNVIRDIILNGTGTVSNLNFYVGLVREIAEKRKLLSVLQSTISSLSKNKVSSITGQLSNELAAFNNKKTDNAYESKEMMQQTVEHISTMHDLKCDGKMAGVPSGMNKLDKILGGFHRSDLVIVGARPGVGKTSMAISCAVNAAKRGYNVGFISTEMSIVQVGMRITSLMSGISSSVMRDSSYEEKDWPRLTAGTKRIAELPLFIYDKPVCTVGEIAMQSRAWQENAGLDILFVDYLTRLKPESGSENKAIAVGNIASDLKNVARSLNIPVVCLAQLNRQVENRTGKRPNMGDLRDSGVIEQEADQILMLCRDRPASKELDATSGIDNENEYAEILIEKNRHGGTAGLLMRFIPETMEWCDKEDFAGYEYQ